MTAGVARRACLCLDALAMDSPGSLELTPRAPRRARSGALLGAWLGLVVALGAPPARGDASAFAAPSPRRELLARASAAFQRLEAAGLVQRRALSVIDYTLPSSERRLWVLDPDTLRVRFHEFVAHGRGSAADSDPSRAVRFGNEPASLRSSLGTFLTGGTYVGQHGRSLELRGLDPGLNDRALERRIVIHPADYASAAFRAQHGRLGRSFGCPSLDPAVAQRVIDAIRDGSVLYAAGRAAEPIASTLR
jgi:hypothetical protein